MKFTFLIENEGIKEVKADSIEEAENKLELDPENTRWSIQAIKVETPRAYTINLSKNKYNERDKYGLIRRLLDGEHFYKDPTIRKIIKISKKRHPHFPSIKIGSLNKHSFEAIYWYLCRLHDYNIKKPDNIDKLMQYCKEHML